MKKNRKTIIYAKQKIGIDHIYEDAPQALKVLESAWDNLPGDISLEEREVFYELSSQIIKLNGSLKKMCNLDDDLKN